MDYNKHTMALSYIDSILKQRTERDRHLIDHPLNWLALCGLFWLEEGRNTFGSDPSNNIVLAGSPVAQAGILVLTNCQINLIELVDSVTVNGKTPESRPLHNDHDNDLDTIELGSLAMRIIRRGESLLLRVWDREAPAVKQFKGLKYYPVDPEYCITAKFIHYDPPLERQTLDMIGSEQKSLFTGKAEFTINGANCQLDAEDADDELLFNFTDLTRADTTYPGGRYITVPKPVQSAVTLDFNRAVNWPCAYTRFATCPLPPFENRLSMRIEAGEKRYHDWSQLI